MSSLEETAAACQAVQKTSNRVSLESCEKEISNVEYHRSDLYPHVTVAYVQLKNGYIVVGTSIPTDPDNFNAELGAKLAYEDAVRQIWPLLAFRMRDWLSEEGKP